MSSNVLQKSSSTIADLPENLLLDIFAYLPIKDVCKIRRVNRQWKRVAADNKLWRHVNLLGCKLNLNKIWKIIRAHFSDVLLSLRLKGNLHAGSIQWKKNTVSDAMLKELQSRCPNVTTLELNHTDLTNVTVNLMPLNLKTLVIKHSSVTPGWFRVLNLNKTLLKHLQHVDLSFSTKTSNGDLKDLCNRLEMSVLKINGCYRISEEGLIAVVTTLKYLSVLQISETGCTDLVVHHMSRNIKNLKQLDLSKCEPITDGSIVTIAKCLKHLEHLTISGCSKLTKDGLKHLNDAQSLKLLEAQNCGISEKDVEELKTNFSDKKLLLD